MTTRTEDIIQLYQQHVMPTYAPGLVLTRGRGTKLWDVDGKVYLDFSSGIAVTNLGHAHPRMLAAIQDQAQQVIHVSNLHYNRPQALLARKLAGLTDGGKSFFCNSGAEANEALIKLARLYGHESSRFEIICMRDSFHGRTMATMAATGQDQIREGFDPTVAGFVHVAFNDLEALREAVTDRTVAIFLEAVQGEGGVRVATPEFMRGIRQLCDERDLLMLCDEVQCGMGRTGQWFGFQHAGVMPDAFSLAKSLGGGYPIGAVVARPGLADIMQPGKHASTFGGSPLACATALAVVETIAEENLLERAASAGTRFKQALETMAARYDRIRGIRGRGLMIGMEADRPVRELSDIMTEMGLITVAGKGHVIRFLPPLTVRDNEMDEALEIIEDSLTEWHGLTDHEGGTDDATQ